LAGGEGESDQEEREGPHKAGVRRAAGRRQASPFFKVTHFARLG